VHADFSDFSHFMRTPSVVTWLQYPLRRGRTPSTFLFRAESELGMQAAERRGAQGREGLCAGNAGGEGNAGVGFKRLWWRRDQTGTQFTCFISTKGTQFTCVIVWYKKTQEAVVVG